MKRSARQSYVLVAVLAYAMLALLWIFLSDRLLANFMDIGSVVWLSTAKGMFFVLVSAAVFYFVLSAVPPEAESTRASADTLLVSLAAHPWSRWFAYGFAVALVALVAVVHSQLSPAFGNHQPLIFFMLPIILAAMLGGFGPGLAATLLAVAIWPYGVSPAGRLHELFQSGLLIFNGLTVSVVSEAMHRLWRSERARRHQADAANVSLRQSEARFRQLFQDAPVAMGLARMDGTLLAANEHFRQLFGYWLEEVSGHEAWWLLAYPDPDYRAQAQARWRTAVAEAGNTRKAIEAGEFRIRCKDGTDRVVRITSLVMAEGLLSAYIDLTEARRAEQALAEAQAAARSSLDERQRISELLAAIVDATDDAIFAKDREGRYLLFNRAASHFVGKPVTNVLGRDDRDLFPPEQAEMLMATGRQVMRQEQALTREEALDTADGPRVFLATKGPLRDAAGRVIGLFGISRDITEQKRAERERQAEQEAALDRQRQVRQALLNQMQDANAARAKAETALAALRELNATLEARVKQRTSELEILTQSLESFVYSVSHDLKAPLRGVEGYGRLLEEDYGDRLNEEGKLFIANILAGVRRMNELIDDLLAYSRMERRKLDTGILTPGLLVRKALEERAADIAARGVEVITDLPPLTVLGDADGLALVLRNLLENALKFCGRSPAPRIEIGARREGGQVRLWVRDNGIGFDMKYHDRIFEIFQRLHRLEDYPGTGIGLALVRKAMERMGGRVWAESEPERGAVFYLELPAAADISSGSNQ